MDRVHPYGSVSVLGILSNDMRIAIDARMMGPENTRGIGRYIEELVRSMVQAAPQHRYVLLTRDPKTSLFIGNASVEHVTADIPWYGLVEQLKMPKLLIEAKPDLVHIPHWNVPITSSLPHVVTIHDLIMLDEPRSARITTRGPVIAGAKYLGYRLALHAALHSKRILAPTQWTASEIHRHFPSLKTPIDITGEGMPHVDEACWADPDPTDQYLLYVGSAYPHKNLDLLFDVWSDVVRRHPTVHLVIAGELDTFMSRLQARATRQKMLNIRFLGRVTDDELSRLYAKALALIYPSKNEGFGLPPLEALAHGCPVLVAQSSSLPEVLGDRGIIFFQPRGTDGILRAIESVLRDPVGVRAQARQAVGSLRERHSWKQAAERTLEAYEQAVRMR